MAHLWQGRFHSCVLDERHLYAAVRYVELNPVRAGLCDRADQLRWSSVQAHVAGFDDSLVTTTPILERVTDWKVYLGLELVERELTVLPKFRERVGRRGAGNSWSDWRR